MKYCSLTRCEIPPSPCAYRDNRWDREAHSYLPRRPAHQRRRHHTRFQRRGVARERRSVRPGGARGADCHRPPGRPSPTAPAIDHRGEFAVIDLDPFECILDALHRATDETGSGSRGIERAWHAIGGSGDDAENGHRQTLRRQARKRRTPGRTCSDPRGILVR